MRTFALLFGIGFLFSCGSKEAQKTDDKTTSDQSDTTEKKEVSVIKDEFRALNYTSTFLGEDSLRVTYQVAEISEKSPYILLCHQAGFSRGEYVETIKTFNELGYNCVAIDQRSGKEANGIINETAARADSMGLEISYLEAEKDIRSAITLIDQISQNDIILLGSSYSASLVLKIAADSSFAFRDRIKAVVSFSPGEYIKNYELTPTLSSINSPVFITAAKNEIEQIEAISQNIPSDKLTLYKPQEESIHGSRALWEETSGSEACWDALSAFLFQLQ